MTDRQAAILAAIVEAHAEVGHPVGSVTLAKLFQVASSTIRGEMNALEQLGYIGQPHVSAGRVPTDKGYRWYVNRLQEGRSPASFADQRRALGTKVKGAGEPEQALKSAIDSLVELTSNAGIGTLGPHLHTGGLGHLFGQPEFVSGQPAQAVACLLDNLEAWLREVSPTKPVSVFIGRENPIGKASGCSLVISRFASPFSDNSYIGVLGPTRQNYRQAMALVEHAGRILEESLEAERR